MASQSTHQDDICQPGLMQRRNMRVQETISGHWQSKAYLPESNMSLPELRNTSPYAGCLTHFMATYCAKVSSKTTSPGKASCIQRKTNMDGVLLWDNSQTHRLSTAIPSLNAQVKTTHSVLPQELSHPFYLQQTRSYLRAGTELYLPLIP